MGLCITKGIPKAIRDQGYWDVKGIPKGGVGVHEMTKYIPKKGIHKRY